MKCLYLPTGKIILTPICRLYWREILETGRSVKEVRIQLRNGEKLNYNSDGRNPEVAFRDIWETNDTESDNSGKWRRVEKVSRFLICT